MRRGHSKYSPSAASRWSSCTASLSFDPGDLPPEEESIYAALGSYLHEVGHQSLVQEVHPADLSWTTELSNLAKKADHFHSGGVTSEDSALIYPYIDYIRHFFPDDSKKFYEQDLEIIPGLSWGTADAVVIHGKNLTVVDYKSGAGVEVDVEENLQLLMYGVGAMKRFDFLYDFERINHVIAQPAFGEPKIWTITPERQREKFEKIVDSVDAIERGDVEFNPTASNCRWCPAKLICPAVEELAVQAARDDFKDDELSVADKYELVPILEAWCSEIKNEVRRLLLNDEEVEGYKIVEGRKSRSWKSEKKVTTFMKKFTPVDSLSNPGSFKSPAQMEALIKAAGISLTEKQSERFKKLIITSPGNPAVAKESDRRKEISKADLAVKDFANVIGKD